MDKPDYFVLTQILIDDIYFPGNRQKKNVLGGGTYTAAGLRIWSEHVGICSGVGSDFEGNYDDWFKRNSIHVAAAPRSERCTHSRINYFADGEREEVLLPGYGSHKLMQPKISEIPEAYSNCKGMYLFKDCEEEFWEDAAQYLRSNSMVSVWEIFSASAAPQNREAVANYISCIDLFSLNLTEGRRLSGENDAVAVMKDLLKLNAKNVILRMGANGALVSDGREIWHVPAVDVGVVDVTGGGNSSTGGFLAGWCESGGNIVRAGVCASVAASFIIQQYGPPPVIDDSVMRMAEEIAKGITVTKL